MGARSNCGCCRESKGHLVIVIEERGHPLHYPIDDIARIGSRSSESGGQTMPFVAAALQGDCSAYQSSLPACRSVGPYLKEGFLSRIISSQRPLPLPLGMTRWPESPHFFRYSQSRQRRSIASHQTELERCRAAPLHCIVNSTTSGEKRKIHCGIECAVCQERRVGRFRIECGFTY